MAKALATANEESDPLPGKFAGSLERTKNFLQEVRGEMRKVVTPSRKEVESTTVVVLITVFAFAGYFYLVDSILGTGIRVVLKWMGASQ